MVSTALGQTPPPKPFIVFDGTLHSNKPDLSVFGIMPITIEYNFAPINQTNGLPFVETVQAMAREAQQKGDVVVLDIESWPLTGPANLVRDSLTKYITVLKWFQEAAPGLSVGYYGAPPIRDYWRAIKNASSQERQSWMAENDQLRSLASAVDIFYPSLYTFYPDQVGWKKYAIAQIVEARRYAGGKPVYVFLWPQYHDSNNTLGGTYLPTDYWLFELETARQYADGIVIWGGWDLKLNKRMIWDDSAPWWGRTKEFLATLPLSRPSPPNAPPASLSVQ